MQYERSRTLSKILWPVLLVGAAGCGSSAGQPDGGTGGTTGASWAGPRTSTSAPTSADVDWIKVYDWQGGAAKGG
jgi:hypothetical protein